MESHTPWRKFAANYPASLEEAVAQFEAEVEKPDAKKEVLLGMCGRIATLTREHYRAKIKGRRRRAK